MITQIFLFATLSFIAYTFIALFGQLTGGVSETLLESMRPIFKPQALMVLLVGNIFFACAIFIGLKITAFAVPAAIAFGVIASFVYSVLFLGGAITAMNVLGVIFILIGIFLLK